MVKETTIKLLALFNKDRVQALIMLILFIASITGWKFQSDAEAKADNLNQVIDIYAGVASENKCKNTGKPFIYRPPPRMLLPKD